MCVTKVSGKELFYNRDIYKRELTLKMGVVLFFLIKKEEGGTEMEGYWLISEAAREVEVESHVLRYWEEELKIPIKRNEQGHRYYTREDVEFFKQIKGMKEKGLQLKAIKLIMKNGDLDVLPDKTDLMLKKSGDDHVETMVEKNVETKEQVQIQRQDIAQVQTRGQAQDVMRGQVQDMPQSQTQDVVHGQAQDMAYMQAQGAANSASLQENKEEKTLRLQWLLQQLIREAVRENNRELTQEIKESVVKELDYQFRNLEEREEQRDAAREQREEEHFRKLDALLRKKSRRVKISKEKTAAQAEEKQKEKSIKLIKRNREK